MSKFPQQALDEIESTEVQTIVTSLQELHALGRPKTDEEFKNRIDEYFAFCQRSSIRPGIESLCLSLHITRQRLYDICNGVSCSEERQQAAQSAKSFIAAYIEQAHLQGKINPASGIFLMKNWLNYKDSISFEEGATQQKETIAKMTIEDRQKELAGLIDVTDIQITESEE